MSLKAGFRKMVTCLSENHAIPPIADIYFPPFYPGGQPKDAEFMAIRLSSGAVGISYVLLPDEKMAAYAALQPSLFVGKDPLEMAIEFGHTDPLKEIVSIAAINAICQHVMLDHQLAMDTATDSLGLLAVKAGDRVGMVGLFSPLVKTIEQVGADLIIVEKKAALIQNFPDLPMTLDAAELKTCNKILCTSTTILNDSLDEILGHCSKDAFVSVIGPTAGYFPDPVFDRGVDVLGGRLVTDGKRFIRLLKERERWGSATQKICFQKKTYQSLVD